MSGFNLSALAVRERSVTLFLLVAISIAGVVAFLMLGRAEDPSFTIKQMTVVTAWPGATAKEMEELVAERLEKRMQELRWYDRTETFTRPGLAFTTVFLRDSTPPADVPEQFYQARKKLGDEAQHLPPGVFGPMVNDEYSDVTFALYALKAQGEPHRHLVREAETLRQRLLRVPGVKKVNIIGEQAEKIFVEFSYDRLATLGVSPRDIFAALNSRNAMTPAGSIEAKGPQVVIRLDGAIDDLQQIRDTAVAAQGRTLKLADIAEVKRGYEDPPSFLIRNNGEPTLLLGVVMREAWNGLDLGKALQVEAAALTAEMPLGMSLSKITDQSVNIRTSVDEFMVKFFFALGVVMLVSFLSMGWRVGIVVAAAVPLTLAAVFIVMAATGKDFDRITLGSLILALGLLVDDAIIAIEMMVVKMEEGYDRIRAAAYAWSHTAAPMLAGTLVTAVGFMPNGFARSTAGEYTSNMFWIVGIALIASWVVAVVFTPYLGVKLLPEHQEGRRRARGDLRHAALQPLPSAAGACHSPQVGGRRRGDRPFFVARTGHGRGQEAVLPDFRPTGSAGRGANAVWHFDRADQRHHRQGRSLAGQAGGSQDRHRLCRPGRAALLSRDGTGAARSVVRQDRRTDGEPGGARGAQAPAATGDRRWPGTRGARARHSAGVRPVFAVPGGLPGHRS